MLVGSNLKETFYLNSEGKKIYHFNDKEFKVNINKIQKKFTEYTSSNNYPEVINLNVEGTILVVFNVNEEGYVSTKIVKSLHPELDNIVESFIIRTFSNRNPNRVTLKTNKVGNTKVEYEFLMPINFSINKFYRAPRNYYFNPDFLLHQQMMMNMNLNHVNPPPRPQY